MDGDVHFRGRLLTSRRLKENDIVRSFSLRYLLISLSISGCLIASQTAAHAIGITLAGGSWGPTIGAGNLTAGAGSNLSTTYTSSADLLSLTISGATGDADNWRVDVHRNDAVWNPGLTVSVKRTSDGLGPGFISGGDVFLPVDATDSSFFTGAGNRSDISVQYRLGGVSLQVPPNTYSTTIVFTVVDI